MFDVRYCSVSHSCGCQAGNETGITNEKMGQTRWPERLAKNDAKRAGTPGGTGLNAQSLLQAIPGGAIKAKVKTQVTFIVHCPEGLLHDLCERLSAKTIDNVT